MGVEGGVGRSPPAVMELGGGIFFDPGRSPFVVTMVPSFMGCRGPPPPSHVMLVGMALM